MRELLKFKRKKGDFRIYHPTEGWETVNGLFYEHYPFIIHKCVKHTSKWVLTHIASGTSACKTSLLKNAKYIATRLLPVPQFLIPNRDLVNHMTVGQKKFCTDIIDRYRDVPIEHLKGLDKNCPFRI